MRASKVSQDGQLVVSARDRARYGLAGAVATGVIALGLACGGIAMQPVQSLADEASDTAQATSEASSLAETVAAKVLPSVGSVYAVIDSNGTQGISSGSCEVVSADGYIVTNFHVVDGATKIQVVLNDVTYDAELVGSDSSSDIAVVKIDPGDTALTPIEFGDSSDLQVGQWVMTVGSPYGEDGSVSVGIVSGLDRTASITIDEYEGTEAYYVGVIQSDAMINSGSSGGAMVNENGEFVGMTTYATTTSGDWAGMTYAIPSNYVKDAVEQIIESGTVEHPVLGVSVVSLLDAYYQGAYSLNNESSVLGAYVARVVDGSGAAEAGVEVGDIITAVNGEEIYSDDDLIIAVRNNSIGDTVTLTVERDGEEMEFEVTLSSDVELEAASESATDESASGDDASDDSSDSADDSSDGGWSWGWGWSSGDDGSDSGSDGSDADGGQGGGFSGDSGSGSMWGYGPGDGQWGGSGSGYGPGMGGSYGGGSGYGPGMGGASGGYGFWGTADTTEVDGTQA